MRGTEADGLKDSCKEEESPKFPTSVRMEAKRGDSTVVCSEQIGD